MEDREKIVFAELKRKAEEQRYGTITVEFKIHEGKIQKGDIIGKRETLG